ncbi:MAG: winged helix-turn-helix transcriptional regulator [Nitrospina sp.]|nr:winged helix-turn-helix transcriptional regulator [Nitrospina sp.]
MKPSKLREISETCTCFNLRKTTRAVTALFDEALNPIGLRATQLTLLAILSRTDNWTVTRLSQTLVMDRTTLTRNLKPMQEQGWVLIRKGEDRRTRTLALSSKGRRLLEKAVPLWDKAQKEVMQRLGNVRWSSLMHHLKVTSSLMSPY